MKSGPPPKRGNGLISDRDRQGEKGQRWSERIWTVIATCVQQGRSVWEYLEETVHAYFTGKDGPTLVPAAK